MDAKERRSCTSNYRQIAILYTSSYMKTPANTKQNATGTVEDYALWNVFFSIIYGGIIVTLSQLDQNVVATKLLKTDIFENHYSLGCNPVAKENLTNLTTITCEQYKSAMWTTYMMITLIYTITKFIT